MPSPVLTTWPSWIDTSAWPNASAMMLWTCGSFRRAATSAFTLLSSPTTGPPLAAYSVSYLT